MKAEISVTEAPGVFKEIQNSPRKILETVGIEALEMVGRRLTEA